MSKRLAIILWFLIATFAFGQGQDSIRAVSGVLTINIVPSKSFYKVFVDQTITSTVFTGQVAGTIATVYFLQDSTGHSVAFGGNIVGPCTVSLSASSTTAIQFVFDSSNNQWTSFGCGSGGVPGQFSVKTYGAAGDARVTQDCSTTANSPIVTSATANWQPSDVGKIFINTSNVSNASNLTGVNETTIASRQSATQVTLAVNAINTLTSQYCVWATQDDTTAFTNAVTAASGALSQISITGSSSRIDKYPGTVFVPIGGYVVSSQLINCQPNASGGLCPSFVGGGMEQTVLYVAPGLTTPLLEWVGANGVELGSFSMTSMAANINAGCSGFACGLIWFSSTQKFRIHDITSKGTIFTGPGGSALIYLTSVGGAHSSAEKITIAGGASAFATPFFGLNGVAEFAARDIFVSNGGGSNLFVASSTTRNATDNPILFENVSSDECGAAPCAKVTASGLNWVGGGVFGEGGAAGAMSVDGTSQVWLTDVNIGSFNTLNNNVGLNIAAGGVVYATMDTIRGNGTSAAVSGTSTSVFNDIGGNQIQNCSGLTCNNVTAAQYATLGFTGGIVPKATVTHTPNTCYAVTGNLLATAQNLCTLLLDQNYQVVNITAQSGGTTPANSSCTGAPVITLSDGTRTGTLTMTTGKTQWSSAVDVSTVNSIFASGTTLTVSIGANTCATPPSNVSVNYVLQSVLNP